MRIALLQATAVPLDPERNLDAIAEAARAACEAGAALLLTPELFVSGYAPRELAAWLSHERVSLFPSRLSALAAGAGIAVAASFPEARSDGTFAIAAGLWDSDGAELLRYEKVHLWGTEEPLAFSAAATCPRVAEWNGRRVGFQICYDIEFPEPARMLAELGADLVLVPTAIDHGSVYVPEVLVRARAAENGIVVAYANHARPAGSASQVGEQEFAGVSVVAGLEGVVIAQAGALPELLLADVPDLGEQAAAGADYLRDRRAGLYESWR